MRFKTAVIGALLFSQYLLTDYVEAQKKKDTKAKDDGEDKDDDDDDKKVVKAVVPPPVFAEKRIKGVSKTLELPLVASIARYESFDKEQRKKSKFEKMELKYWTTLVEPKKCVKAPFGCPIKDYEQILEGEITLSNINVYDWPPIYNANTNGGNKYSTKGNNLLEIRLGFD